MAKSIGRMSSVTKSKRKPSAKARRSRRADGGPAVEAANGAYFKTLGQKHRTASKPRFKSAPDWQQNLVKNLIKQGYSVAAARSLVNEIAA